MSAAGERSGPVAEGELDVGQRFANGYESDGRATALIPPCCSITSSAG
jgi:hypothetical protein